VTTYELDDADVRAYLESDVSTRFPGLYGALKSQLPIPVPTKVGAVVRTEEHGLLTRICEDNHHTAEWRQPSGREVSAEQIQRTKVEEVLSEGVDL
jgi:hypothetical protein